MKLVDSEVCGLSRIMKRTLALEEMLLLNILNVISQW